MVAHRCGGGEAPENTLERALAAKFCSGDGMRLSCSIDFYSLFMFI